MANTETTRLEIKLPLDDYEAVIAAPGNLAKKTNRNFQKASTLLIRIMRKPQPKVAEVPEHIRQMDHQALSEEIERHQQIANACRYYEFSGGHRYTEETQRYNDAILALVMLDTEMNQRNQMELAA